MEKTTRIIVMLGPQGSGKGTQAELVSARFGIPAISLGQLFRKEIDRGSELGKEIEGMVKVGDRVPSPIVDRLVTARLSQPDAAGGAILDGYPRAIDQLEELDLILARHGHRVTDVVFLDIPDDESRRRLSGRWVCSNTDCEAKYHVPLHPPKTPGICDRCGGKIVQRADDTPAGIEHRLSLYHRDTKPLVAAYQDRGLLRHIDGTKSIAEVAEEVHQKLG